MIRGIYTAASGLLTNLRRQEAISNNLANVNTTGYKQDAAADSSFEHVFARRVGNAGVPVPLTFQRNLGTIGSGAYQDDRRPYLRQGTLTRTDQALDVAVVGDGLFSVQAASGETLYTRDGHFTTNEAGEIVTPEGRQLLDVNGAPIVVGGAEVVILRTGDVVANGETVATIGLFDIPATELVRAEGSAFTAVGAVTPLAAGSDPRIEQGALEQSNTDLAEEATRLISTSRQYEASQQVFREISANLERAVNEIGRVG